MNHFETQSGLDPRVRQTRMALFQAFAALVLERDYEDIRVADISGKAGVSRSTFYQHYRSKDDMLAGSMSGMFSVLADAACSRGDAPALTGVLEHWWQNRTLGRVILSGPASPRLAAELTRIIETRLAERQTAAVPQSMTRLRAVQLAEGQLGLLRAWLAGRVHCHPADLALQLLA